MRNIYVYLIVSINYDDLIMIIENSKITLIIIICISYNILYSIFHILKYYN